MALVLRALEFPEEQIVHEYLLSNAGFDTQARRYAVMLRLGSAFTITASEVKQACINTVTDACSTLSLLIVM